MDPISSRQLEGVVNTMNDAFRLVVTACERSRDCAADVSRARDGGRGAQSLDAEGTLLDVLAVAKQKAKGLESTAESALRQLSVRLGQSEETLSEKDRGQLMSEHLDPLFACFLESLGQFYSSSAEHLATLVGRHGGASESSEITMQWLSAAQANNSLRAVGHLSRNELRYLVRASDNEGLPYLIMEQLTGKVHQFVNAYMLELKKLSSSTSSYKLCGGFHMHPTLIEQALRDCCSDWEAKSAGASPAESLQDRRVQINMDIPKMTLKVDSASFGPAAEGQREQNIAEKEDAIRNLVSRLANASVHPSKVRSQGIEEFASLVLLHTCPSVTNTPSKVAVQLLYGVADFIQVVPVRGAVMVKGEEKSVEVRIRKNEKLEIASHSTWGLSVDSRLLSLGQWPMDKGPCGLVEVKHMQELNLHKFMEKSPQPPPRLVVSLIQPPEGMPLSGGAWPSHPVWPLEVPTTPPDNVYPLPSPTSTGVSNSEEEADQEREEGTLGQGQFKRTRPVRGKRSGTSHRTRERSNSDTMLPHSGSDSTLQKDGSSRCSTPDSSESDDAKTEDTATTMTLLAQGDRGESHPVEILSVLTLDHGLTQRQLQLHGNAKKKDRSGPARHLSGESSAARSAVRRPRREDTGDKESPGPVPRNHMLEQSIDFLSQRYDVHSLGERGSQSSGYHSPGNFSSRNGSFRSDTGVSEWYPLGRGDLGVGFPAHPAGGGGPGFQPSMEQHPGGARSPFDQWSNEPHQQMQLPPFKSNSSASLHLLSEHRADSVTSSISASPWSEMEEYDSRLNDPDFQGSDTSIFARQFKEKQASLPPPPPGPPGMMRSRSLEDIRKVGPSPVIGPNWDSVQSLSSVGVNSEQYFPDPSDARSRYHNRSQPHSREGSVDRGMSPMRGRGMPPPSMHRQGPPPPTRNFQHMDRPMQHHLTFPEHHPLPFRDFPPGPPRPPGHPGPPPPGPSHFRGPPGAPYFSPGPGPMPPGPQGPPPGPGGMGPGGQPHWDPRMFQPIYHPTSPFGSSPSPQPRPTPPETPPPMERQYNPHSPHPHHPHHLPYRGARDSMMPQQPQFVHENPQGYPLRPNLRPPVSGVPQGPVWHRYR